MPSARARLREALEPERVEELLDQQRDLDGLREADVVRGVEVEEHELRSRGRPSASTRRSCRRRPMSTIQKDAPKGIAGLDSDRPAGWSRRGSRHGSAGRIHAPLVFNPDELLPRLLWMVNMACIDMNVWYSRIDKPSRPEFVPSDLDPSDDVGFPETVQVALLIKELLDALGLESFPKTSGADGMQHPRSLWSRAVTPTTTRASSPRSSPGRSSTDAPRLSRHPDRVVEGEAARRPRRREPERRGQDDPPPSPFGAPEGGRAGLRRSAERGEREARPGRVHDGGRARPRRGARRPLRRRAGLQAIALGCARARSLAATARARRRLRRRP